MIITNNVLSFSENLVGVSIKLEQKVSSFKVVVFHSTKAIFIDVACMVYAIWLQCIQLSSRFALYCGPPVPYFGSV